MSKNDKTIQEKMNQLSELVAWFESDEFELEAAIEKYKTAEVLADESGKGLSERKNEITVLNEKFDS